jgi:hypothetical protein
VHKKQAVNANEKENQDMAWDNEVNLSYNATLAIPDTANFTFMELDTNGGAVTCTQGGLAIGVCQEGASAGDPIPVCKVGSITKVLCSATVTPSQFVASDAAGNAVPATSGAHFLGQVVQGATAGFLAVILFQPSGAKS